MATILYLDIDDEITSAAARMRSADDGPLGLVVPPGSRIATSRINFRLLAREAQSRGRSLSIVAGDAATRALAASAGLATFASVGEYEASFEAPAGDGQGDRRGGGLAAAAGGAGLAAAAGGGLAAAGSTASAGEATEAEAGAARSGSAPAQAERSKRTRRGDLEATAVVAPKAPPLADAESAAGREAGERSGPLPVVGPRRRLPGGRPMLVGLAVLLVALVAGGVAAFVFLPSATITLTPRIEAIGPVTLEVRADPTATRPDAVAAVVPAERLSFDFSATESFPATGKRVEETKATGEVTFSNYDFTSANSIPAGSVVSTEGGIQFRTTTAVTLPAADFVIPQVIPSERNVPIEAVAGGPGANVAANAITVVPPEENPTYTRVTNRQPTSGGARAEFPRIQQADVNAAVEQLTAQLRAQFDARLADPAAAPEGMTLFPDTRALGTPTPAVDPASLVGQEVATFELTMTAVGEVTAVDERPLATVGEEHIRDQVDADHRLVDDSIAVEVGEATPDGASLVFPVTVRAAQVRILDRDALLAEIRGRPLTQARAILEPYGAVELSVWPDWVTAVPTIDGRATLTIADAASEASPSAGSSGAPATRPSSAPPSPSAVPSPEASAPTGSAP